MSKFRLPKVTMTTDIVIFTIRSERLEILLIQRGNPPFQGDWALPGGLLEETEDLDVCAQRELEEETSVAGLKLEQLHAFGKPGRDPRGRMVTVAYFTIVRPDRLAPKAGDDAAHVQWFAVDEVPALAFDHADIIRMARRRLRARFEEGLDAFGFLPENFPLDELRKVFEIIAGERLDARKFGAGYWRWSLSSRPGRRRQPLAERRSFIARQPHETV